MAEEVAKELSQAKNHRGAARASITQLKENIVKLEAKPELSKLPDDSSSHQEIGRLGC